LLPPHAFHRLKICGRGSGPDPTGGAYSAPPDLLAGKEGGAPGMHPRKGDPREGEGEEEKGKGAGRGKLLPPDVRFYG